LLSGIRWFVDSFCFLYGDFDLIDDIIQPVVLGQAYPDQSYKVSKAVIGLADVPPDEFQKQIHDHGYEDLRLAGVFAGSQKCFDLQVLLDELKKNLNVPPALIQLGNGPRRPFQVIRNHLNGLRYSRIRS
jgi:hypothetical protein